MAVTLGLMFRIDGQPPAVPVPPLQQGMTPVRPIIEAERVVEPTSTARGNEARNHMLNRSGDYAPERQQPMTYSQKGLPGDAGQLLSGQLLDTYA